MSLTDNLESPVAHEVDLRAMLDPAATAEVSRIMQICNACRYCEGFCAVFPAMERRRLFAEGDVSYLANLCHNCGACYHACQYAPPHEFGVNVPVAMAAAINCLQDRVRSCPLQDTFTASQNPCVMRTSSTCAS